MMFDSYEKLKGYAGKWLSESDFDFLWKWVQEGLVTEEQIIEITKKCCCDEQCVTESLRENAWVAFIKSHLNR